MKRLLLLILLSFSIFQGFSQTKGISYQAVILNPNPQELPGVNAQNNILANSTVSIQFTIVNASGTEEYQEQHNTQTDMYGMINLLIGTGISTSGTDFTDIFWDGTTKKLKVEIDFLGGSNFSHLSEQNLTYMPQPPTEEVTIEIANISSAISVEKSRAELVEQELFKEIEKEKIRVIEVETTNSTAIANEIIRATEEESNLFINLTTEITNRENADLLKEDLVNKSTNILIDGSSDIKYPSVKATKNYVDTGLNDITTLAEGKVYLGNSSNEATEVTLIGDVTLNNLGVSTIGTSKVVSSMIANETIKTEDISDESITTSKISDASVTNAKLDKTTIPLSGFAVAETDVALGGNKLTGVSDPTLLQDAATKNYVDTGLNAITALAEGKVYLGNSSNEATEVTLTGDVTLNNLGVSTIGTSKVVSSMIANETIKTEDISDESITTSKISDASVTNAKLDKTTIPLSGFAVAETDVALGGNKLTGVSDPTLLQDAATKNYVDTGLNAITALAEGKVYLGNSSNEATEVTLTGDVTLNNSGVSTIGASKVVSSMIANETIKTEDISDESITTSKISDASVTNAKLDKTTIPLSGFATAESDVAFGGNKLTGVLDPTLLQDAATKNYVDTGLNVITALAEGKVYLGNSSNEATEVTLTGDVTLDNSGVSTIGTSKVVSSMIANETIKTEDISDESITTSKISDASVTNAKLDKTNIALSGFATAETDVALGGNKLIGVSDPTLLQDAATKNYVDTGLNAITTLAEGKVYLGNSSNEATEVTLTGDVTLDNSGVSTIGTSKVVSSMIANETIKTEDISDESITTSKISDASVTNAKLDKTNIALSGFATAETDVALGGNKLIGVSDPTLLQDAATKNYVDTGLNAITTLAEGKVYLGNSSNEATEVTLTGDVTLDNSGISTIGTSKVVSSMIATETIKTEDISEGSITTSKISDASVTAGKLADGLITTSKISNASVTNMKVASGIDVLKLADGSVSNSELEYINTLTSNAQAQLNAKADLTLSNLSNTSTGRSNLGVAIGSDVQAYDADLDDLADGILSANKVENGITTSGTSGEVWTSDGSGAGIWSVPSTSVIHVGAGLVISGGGTAANPYNVSLPSGGTAGQVLTIGTDGVPAWEDPSNGGSIYYLDADGDGYGDINEPIVAASMPTGYVNDNTDCDDTDSGLYPSVVWYADVDGDGYGDASSSETGCTSTLANATHDNTDCNDSDASVNPGETEIADDGIDNDCDGETDEAEIGQLRGGGIVFYIASTPTDLDGDGDLENGLVAATADQASVYWGSNGLIGASGDNLGEGGSNTNTIIAAKGTGTYGASVARAYGGGGYSDWFLPSKVELRVIYNSLALQGIGGFTSNWYMSSTELNSSEIWVHSMGSKSYARSSKSDNSLKIRAVRAF